MPTKVGCDFCSRGIGMVEKKNLLTLDEQQVFGI